MSQFTFADAAPSYAHLWSTMTVAPDKASQCAKIALSLVGDRARYRVVSGVTGVPWFAIALIDQMEAGGGCNKHLHNGDPLHARTVHVPIGRPPAPAEPPFTWEVSACDALAYDGLDDVTDWSIERLCFELETYNGFGYRSRDINTPYLWSFSNQYTAGKFVRDGVFDPHAVSDQAGAMPILKALMAIDRSVTFAPAVASTAGKPSLLATILSWFKRA